MPLRPLARALRRVGWAILWLAAAVGVLLSTAALIAALPVTRPLLAQALVRRADEALAGRMELDGVAVLPHGGVELRGLRVFDPEGEVVLRVERVGLFVDALALVDREVAVKADLEGVDADAARRAPDGSLALASAFAPARAERGPAPGRGGERVTPAAREGAGWAFRLQRLSMARGRVRAGPAAEPVEVTGLSLTARGRWGARAARIEARVDGEMAAPVAAPLTLELLAERRGDRVELQRLALGLGEDRVEAVGEGDVRRRTARVAVTRLDLSRGEAGALAPAARLGGDLKGTLYFESDGEIATASLEVAPAGGRAEGRATIAAALRVAPAAPAWGLLADVDRLDPSRLSTLAPPGRVTLRGRGAGSGRRLTELAGRVELRVERSRLRGGELGPIELQATGEEGAVQVTRLDVAAPGGRLDGRLRWRRGRELSGDLTLAARDLDRLERNLSAVLGRRLPDLAGAGRASVTVSGSAGAPRLDAMVDASALALGGVRVEGARLRVQLQGPAVTGSGAVQGSLLRAQIGGLELRRVQLDATVREEEGSLSFSASAPKLGSELLRVMLRGRFGPARDHFDLSDAAVAWPGTRFELAQPARIGFAIPAVDRLVLVAGPQRIEAEGGLDRAGRLDARVRGSNLDLARIPGGLAPPRAALEGQLTFDARASGSRAAPRVDATLGLARGSAFEVGGLDLRGSAGWDGSAGRIEADLELRRERGGALDLALDLPLALGSARPDSPIRVELQGKGVPLDELVWLAGSYALVSGEVDAGVELGGTVGSPSLRARLSVREGTWDDLEGLGLEGTLEAAEGSAKVRAQATLAGGGAGSAEAEVDVELSRLLSRPGAVLAAARRAPFSLALKVPSASLAPLAGRLELAGDLAGRVEAEAKLGGVIDAPRGTLAASLEGGAGWGARAVAARVVVSLAPERTGATVDLQLGGRQAAKLQGAVELPAERLRDRSALDAAPFGAALTIARSDLAAWGGELVALRGRVEGRGALRGTLGAPQAELFLHATDAAVEGRPLGVVAIEARYAARRSAVVVDLQPPAGGALHAEGALDRPFGIGARRGPILEAPAELRVHADRLDLGFLPALAPRLVRSAAGAATLDLSAAGPLGSLRPRGTFRVANGRLALAELGDWTDAVVELDLGEDEVRLGRFDVRKGKGRLSVRGLLSGLSRADGPAELEAIVESEDFGVERAGQELVRLDLKAEARGRLARDGLTLGIAVPQADVKLPKRIPRTLQGLERRKDITVGRPTPPRARRPARPAPRAGAPAAPPEEPFKTVLHVVAPRRLRVRADQPRIDVELRADVLLAFAGAREEATGFIEAIRGQVEPIGQRVFELERGKVTFTGGTVASATLDVVAKYDNPTAKVRAALVGTLGEPKLVLSSEPPLEEAQIAMLVATGRTEVKAGSEGVNSLAAGDAGLAAAGALITGLFKDLLSDKLPVDSVSLDATAVSVGKYLTDRIYVSYVQRFEANPAKGENPGEIRIEYQLAPGWQVETRYGSAQSGSASVVWTKNY